MGCKMSRSAGVKGRRKANKKDALSESSTIRSVDMFPHVDELQTMKRAQLQKFCKKAGIKATGKNAELIDRLKEHISSIETNNNNSDETKILSPRTTSSGGELHNEHSEIHNNTFEVSSSAVSIHDQVHITSISTPVSHRGPVCDLQTHLSGRVDIPVSPTEVHVGDEELEEGGVSCGVLKESNKNNTDADANCSMKLKTMAHTRWCVVEGLLKQGDKSSWRRIHLIGGRPVISNRFGKCVSFVLEPSGIPTPENCDDNYICGTCVTNNESYLRAKAALRGVSSDLSLICQQGIDLENQGTPHRIPTSSNHRSFTKIGSVKRKRREDNCAANTSGECDNLEKKRKQDSMTSCKPGTPASPQVRRARGEKLSLPRNIHNPWRPKKSRKATDHIKEDIDFAKRVEEIIKNTMPGSEEEMCMIMSSKAGRVQRSPTKSGE